MVSSAGVTVAKGACHLLNTFSIIQITKSAGVKIKVNIAHPTHHLEGRLKQRELKYKIQNQPASFSIQSNLFVFLSIINNIQPTKPNTTSSAAGVATATAAAA